MIKQKVISKEEVLNQRLIYTDPINTKNRELFFDFSKCRSFRKFPLFSEVFPVY